MIDLWILYFSKDYAVQIFHDALTTGHHTYYLKADTRLTMMYIDNYLNSLHQMMSAPKVFHEIVNSVYRKLCMIIKAIKYSC